LLQEKKNSTMADRRSEKNETVFHSWAPEEIRAFFEKQQANSVEIRSEHRGVQIVCQRFLGSFQNGYPSVSQGHAKSKLKVHIAATFFAHGQLPEAHKTVCSHLCHNKWCINPNHLVIETITLNNSRKGCLSYLTDSSGVVWNLCSHGPNYCLKRDEENLSGFAPTPL